MFDWFGAAKAAKDALSGAQDAYDKRKQRLLELQWDFFLEAIGRSPSCLFPDDHPPGSVTFETVDLRVHLLQDSEPERARECGIPAVNDPKREERLRLILRELVRAGRLWRCQIGDRWEMPRDS